jgi:hypothetical protein
MRTLLLYTVLALSLFVFSGCEAALAEAATVEPIAASQFIPAELADDYRAYQTIFDAAVMDQTLFHKYDDILVRWEENMLLKQEIALRIQRTDGRIYGERITWVQAGSIINLGEAYVLPDGEFDVVLMPVPGVYYGDGPRIERRIRIQSQARQ